MSTTTSSKASAANKYNPKDIGVGKYFTDEFKTLLAGGVEGMDNYWVTGGTCACIYSLGGH